jgi:cytoskeletal protein CcmA (bactofilin family)
MFNPKEKGIASDAPVRSTNVNMIGEGTTVRGTIEADGDLRVAGLVNGNIRCKGKVIVAQTGKISGDLSAEEADIAGHVKGQLAIQRKLSLRNGCEVEGDIFTKSLLIEDGALYEGRCIMRESSASVNPISKASEAN